MSLSSPDNHWCIVGDPTMDPWLSGINNDIVISEGNACVMSCLVVSSLVLSCLVFNFITYDQPFGPHAATNTDPPANTTR